MSEFKNFYRLSYSWPNEAYSFSKLFLKSTKSLADVISYSSRFLMASLIFSISDWILLITSATTALATYSLVSWPNIWKDLRLPFSSVSSIYTSFEPSFTKSLTAFSLNIVAYMLSLSAYSLRSSSSMRETCFSLDSISLWIHSSTSRACLYSRSVSMKRELASHLYLRYMGVLLLLCQ